VSWNFANELRKYGPQSPPTIVGGLSHARSYCTRVARSHYENFTVASVLLPRKLLPHFHAVYAYCRWADDLADETAGGAESLALLDWWRGELNAAYDGEPRHPVLVALRETARRFGIPRRLFLDLLVAFEQDQRKKSYATFDELLDYCKNSANPVGRLVLHLFECFDEERGRLSDEVCTGLQLANFWQDVARDHSIGRVYLPEEDRRRFGYGEEDLAARRFTPAFRNLMRHEVERTRGYFDRGRALLPRLPRRARIDVTLFVRGGEATLNAIEAVDYDVWVARPTVSKRRKARLLLQSIWEVARASTIRRR
jgi:squalene synthase HpnC